MLKNCFFVYKNKLSKYKVEKVAIWQYFLKSGKHRHTLFYICVLSFSNEILHYNEAGQQFYAPCKRVTSSLQKRKHHKRLFGVV